MPIIHRGLATAALVSGVVLTAVLPQEMPPAVSTAAPAGMVQPVALQLGVHGAGAGAGAGAEVARFSAWSGSRVDRVVVELPAGSVGRLDALLAPYAEAGVTLELTLHPALDDTDWRAVGERLVALGLTTADLKLAADIPSAPATSQRLRDAVSALRTVPGQRFRFLFGAEVGEGSEGAYPGDDYVDAVAVTVPAATTSVGGSPPDGLVDGDHGFARWSAFAADHAKTFGISRWAASPQDDPATIDRIFDWIIDPANQVSFASYAHDPAATRSAGRYQVRASALAPLL